MPTPVLHILAGPNGAGKTSLYEATIRRLTDAEFVNADRMARDALGKHATSLEEAQLGQRLANDRRDALLAARASFVTESTFSHPSKLELIQRARSLGYNVVTYHLGLDSADLAVARVAERRAHGGHPVPEDRIRKRYDRNRPLIRRAVLVSDGGLVFDNSVLGQPPRRLITFVEGMPHLVSRDLPRWVEEVYADDLARVRGVG